MNRLRLIFAASLITFSALAQGTVIFNNRIGPVDAKIGGIFFFNGAGVYGAKAQLLLVGAGGALTPLIPATTFRSNEDSPQAYYLVHQIVSVPGIGAGQSATFRVRAWAAGDNWDSALWRGQSNDVYVERLGGTPTGGGAPIPDPPLIGLQPFFILMPEPSTLALGALGVAGLMLLRRK